MTAVFIMLCTLCFRCLLIAFYFTLIYAVIRRVKKLLPKMNAKANYYCWYTLPLAIVLSYLKFNNFFIGLLFRLMYSVPYGNMAGYLLSMAWTVTVIYKLTRHILLNRKIRKSLRSMERYDDGGRLAERAASALGLRRKPDILVADYINAPVSYGFFKKTIITNYKKYSSDELYLLFLHEMAHIKNGDTVKLHIVNLVGCLLWLTPAVHRFAKSFKQDSEILCDHRVMSICDDRDTYGSLILRECADRNAAAGFAFSDSYYAIENRLNALYRHQPEKRGAPILIGVVAVTVLLISCVLHSIDVGMILINDEYYTEFEIAFVSADYSEFEFLDASLYSGVYEVIGDELRVDKLVLRELLNDVEGKRFERVYLNSVNMITGTNGTVGMGGNGMYFTFDELANTSEQERYASENIAKRSTAEYLFLRIASLL